MLYADGVLSINIYILFEIAIFGERKVIFHQISLIIGDYFNHLKIAKKGSPFRRVKKQNIITSHGNP